MAEHSALYEKYKTRYARGGCTKEQLARLAGLGVITSGEYREITGEDL